LELLISGSETSDALSNSNIKSLKTISGVKLLKEVEKSYDKGVKLLDASGKESINRYRLDNDEPEFNAEESKIVAQAKKDGNFMKAPNGKPTRLNAKQWAQVRTKAIKDWFGDWENNPEEASKAVDENSEPMVVNHTTYSDFNEFDKSYFGENTDFNASDENFMKTASQ
jgi:hypothetical protein